MLQMIQKPCQKDLVVMLLVTFRRVFFVFLFSFVAGVPVVEVHQKEADLDDLANSSFSDSLLDDE